MMLNWVIMFTQEKAPWQTLTYSNLKLKANWKHIRGKTFQFLI